MKSNWNFKKEQLTVFHVTAELSIVLSVLLVVDTFLIASASAISMFLAVALCALCFFRLFVPQYRKQLFFSVLAVAVAGWCWWLVQSIQMLQATTFYLLFEQNWNSMQFFFVDYVVFLLLYATIALSLVAQVLLERVQEPKKRTLLSYFGLVVFFGIFWSVSLCTDIYFENAMDWQPFVRLFINIATLWLLHKGISARYEDFPLQKRFGRKHLWSYLLLFPYIVVVLWNITCVASVTEESDLFHLILHSVLQDVTFLSEVCVCTMLVVLGICVMKHLALSSKQRLLLPMLALPLEFAALMVTIAPCLLWSVGKEDFYAGSTFDYFNRLVYTEGRILLPYSAILFALLGVFVTLFYYRYYDVIKAALCVYSVHTVWLMITGMGANIYDGTAFTANIFFMVFLMTLVLFVPSLIFSIVQWRKNHCTLIARFDQQVEDEQAHELEAMHRADKVT